MMDPRQCSLFFHRTFLSHFLRALAAAEMWSAAAGAGQAVAAAAAAVPPPAAPRRDYPALFARGANGRGCPPLFLAPMEGLGDRRLRRALALSTGGVHEACRALHLVPDSLFTLHRCTRSRSRTYSPHPPLPRLTPPVPTSSSAYLSLIAIIFHFFSTWHLALCTGGFDEACREFTRVPGTLSQGAKPEKLLRGIALGGYDAEELMRPGGWGLDENGDDGGGGRDKQTSQYRPPRHVIVTSHPTHCEPSFLELSCIRVLELHGNL